MLSLLQSVTVVIATTAEPARSLSLKKAINSCLKQIEVNVRVIVVVNGSRYCVELNQWLQNHADIDYFYQKEGNYPLAIYFGRQKVNTPFYCFLDDDDELLPMSIATRVAPLIKDDSIDAVICNGLWHNDSGQQTALWSDDVFRCYLENSRSLEALCQNGNWLASSAALYRSSKVGSDFFLDYAKHLEWTYFAFKLALRFDIYFINTLGYRINYTPTSLSKSFDYTLGLYNANLKILNLHLPKFANSAVLSRGYILAHDISSAALEKQMYRLAIQYHLKSLGSVSSFLRYFFFGRHLLVAAIKKVLPS